MNREDTVSLIRSLITAKKDLYELPEFLSDFRREAGSDLPLFDYKTIEDFLGSLPEILQLVTMNQKTCVKPMNNTKSSHVGSGESGESARAPNKSMKDRQHEQTGHRAENHRECQSHNEPEAGEGTSKKVKPETTTAKVAKESSSESTLRNSLTTIDLDESKGECSGTVEPVPSDLQRINILLDESEIPKIDLASFAKVGIYIEVCVPEACHPNKFILQLRKSKIKLVTLMNRMQEFYKQLKDQNLPNNSEWEPNQLCAALYKTRPDFEEWHRAKILKCSNEFSTVLLIDYGLITNINNCNLRYLDRMFGELPVQAMHGHLANIKPLNAEFWPEESRKRFFELVFEKDLLAGIVAFSCEDMWISVALTQTREDEFHIGDTLVEEALAILASDYLDEPDIPSIEDDAIKSERFIRPEEVGKTRRLRSVIEEWVKPEDRDILVYTSCNDRLKEMFSEAEKGEENSEEDSDSE